MTRSSLGPARISGPSWRDPRLYVGLVLVLLAAAGSFLTLTRANKTEMYLVAGRDLATGTAIEGGTAERRLNLGESAAGYLKPGDPRLNGAKLRRPLPAGALIGADDLVRNETDLGRSYALTLEQPVPEGVRVGAEVEVWISAKSKETGSQAFRAPEAAVRSAEILKIETGTGGLAGSSKTVVHLILKKEDLPVVIDAVANEAKIVLAPVQEQK